jgi:hypothetical protein
VNKRPASVQCNGGPHLYHITVQFVDGSLMEINICTTGEEVPSLPSGFVCR